MNHYFLRAVRSSTRKTAISEADTEPNTVEEFADAESPGSDSANTSQNMVTDEVMSILNCFMKHIDEKFTKHTKSFNSLLQEQTVNIREEINLLLGKAITSIDSKIKEEIDKVNSKFELLQDDMQRKDRIVEVVIRGSLSLPMIILVKYY